MEDVGAVEGKPCREVGMFGVTRHDVWCVWPSRSRALSHLD
jgi:hypothetical protein